MKSLNSIPALILIVVFVVTACTKNGEPNAPAGQIAISKLKVKINEPDSMLFVAADTNKAVNWSISPSGSDELEARKTAALIKFTKAGQYTIKASNGDITSNTITVTVIDSVYEPVYVAKFSAGEQVHITPSIIKKGAKSDSTYLQLTATTKNSYCTNSNLDFGIWFNSSDGNYYVQANGIIFFIPQCGVGSHTLSRTVDFSGYFTPLVPGKYPLHIAYGGTTYYNGVIEVTDTQVIFHWDDSADLVISPNTLTR